jgi:hypothetical protein
MATLTGSTIASRYKSLLKVTGSSNDVLSANDLKIIEDGDGNNSAIQLAKNRIEIIPALANHAKAFEVSQQDGTQIFNIASDTPALTINAATVTLSQDTDFVTSGAINGMSIDGTTFSVDGSNNRVGIGTATPDNQLEILGTTLPQVRLTHTDNTDYATFSVDGDGQLDITTVDGGGANGHICLMPDGNVGIGTVAAPVSILEIRDGDGTGGAILTLSTKETAVDADDVLGRINFQAPLEGSVTDAILPGASIHALAHDTFAANNNETSLVFSTASSDAEYGTATNGALFERMRISSDGRVGIGTATPDSLLHLKTASQGAALIIESTGATADDAAPELHLLRSANLTDSGDLGEISFQGWDDGSNDTIYARIKAEINDEAGGTEDGRLILSVIKNNSLYNNILCKGEEVEINGKVGIGTSAPETLLHLEDKLGADQNLVFAGGNTAADSNPGFIIDSRNDDNDGQEDLTLQGHPIILSSSLVGIGTAVPDMPLNISATTGFLGINSTGSNNSGIEWAQGTAPGDAKWQMYNVGSGSHTIKMVPAGAGAGCEIAQSGTIWTAISDERVKENITNIDIGLDCILAMRPVRFKYKEIMGGLNGIGFVAQEMKLVLPDVVYGEEDNWKIIPEIPNKLNDDGNVIKRGRPEESVDHLTVGQTEIIPVLVKAIQELSAKVTALENA